MYIICNCTMEKKNIIIPDWVTLTDGDIWAWLLLIEVIKFAPLLQKLAIPVLPKVATFPGNAEVRFPAKFAERLPPRPVARLPERPEEGFCVASVLCSKDGSKVCWKIMDKISFNEKSPLNREKLNIKKMDMVLIRERGWSVFFVLLKNLK